MEFYTRRHQFVERALGRLADNLGFHPVAIADPGLAPFAQLAEHVVLRRHPDGFDQMIVLVDADSPRDVAESAGRAAAFATEHADLLRDKKLRIFLIGIGLGRALCGERRRLLTEQRLLNDHLVIRRFFLSLDHRRLYACSSPWSFAPGFAINPCDPDENVFVDLVRGDRYLKGSSATITDEDHRSALAKEQVFLAGLTGGRAVVRTLIALNILVWLLLECVGRSTLPDLLLRAGAKSNGLILAGQYWRLVTPVFLHYGFVHLLINSAGLLFLGETVERVYGAMTFALVYFAAGIASVVASFFFGREMMVGASGAIFGLAGALVVYGLRYRGRIPRRFETMFGVGLLPLIGLNILFGVLTPRVDNWAHLGGLVAGAAVALLVRPLADELTPASGTSPRRLAALVVIGIVAGSVALAANHFVRWPDAFEADAHWTLARRIPGRLDLDIPATWTEMARQDNATAWRAVAYDAFLDARAIDASKNTYAVILAEIERFRKADFRFATGVNEILRDLSNQNRVDFRLAHPKGRVRQQSLILLGRTLLSVGVEFPDRLAAPLQPVLERIGSSLPTPE